MVDIGVPYKDIKPHLYKTKYVLITHIHTDHIKKATYNRVRKDFPAIEIVANWQVAQRYPVDHIIPGVGDLQIGPYTLTPFEAVHDVLCHGFVWETPYLPPRTAQGDMDGSDPLPTTSRIIYCTDTSNLDSAPPGPYDYLFLESNHDEKKIEAVRGQKSGGYDPYLSAMRHLSTKACKTFYYLNRRDKDSELIELHRSERFY